VVGGVAYASVKELTFTWLAFSCAMASNVVSTVTTPRHQSGQMEAPLVRCLYVGERRIGSDEVLSSGVEGGRLTAPLCLPLCRCARAVRWW
jgi:hypothetical protein